MFRFLFSVSILIGFLLLASNINFAQPPTPTPCQTPSVPTVSATAGPGRKTITITGSVPTGGSTQIYISEGNGSNLLVTLYPASTTYIASGLDTFRTFYFFGISRNDCNLFSSPSGIVQATTLDIDAPTLSLDNSVHRKIAATVSVPDDAEYTEIFVATSPFGEICPTINPNARIYQADPKTYLAAGLDTNARYYFCAVAKAGSRRKETRSDTITKDIDAPSLSATDIGANRISMNTDVPAGAEYTKLYLSLSPMPEQCNNENQYVALISINGPSSFIFTATPNTTYYMCAAAISGTRRKVTKIIVQFSGDVNAGDTCPTQSVGAPVNVTNGNMWLQQSDYSLSGGVGESVNISRTYNSITQSSGLFGNNWSTELDESIVVKDSYVVAWMLPNGRGVYFGRSSTTTPFFPVIPGTYEQLVKNTDNTYTVTFKDGRIHRFGANGKILYKQDRNGNQTTYNYGTNGNLANITDAFGRTIFFTITNGLVTQITDAIGIVATYDYFPSTFNLKSVTYLDGSKYQFEYGVFGGKTVLTTVKDALNNILETHAYDSSARATTSEMHGGVEKYTLDYSQLYATIPYTTVTDAFGRVTRYYVDRSKQRHVITKVEGSCNCGGSSQTTNYEYDANLNKTKKTDGNGNITTMTYDANGNMLTETDPTGTKTYTYNANGQVLTATDQMSGVTTMVYNVTGQPLTLTDALSKVTTLTYNTRGQVLTLKDARNKTTTLTYDAFGNLSQVKDPNLKLTTFTYDARNRMLTQKNALNFTTTFAYDLNNRVNKITYPDLKFVEYTYDLAGRRTSAKNELGRITNFGYDAAYRLTTVTDPLINSTTYGYDLMSNRTSMTDALGNVTNYEYDDFNRLKRILYPAATVGAVRLEERIEYDLVGNVKKRIDTANRETVYTYDAANRLIKTTDADLKDTTFEYNARSQMTAVVDALFQRYDFTYDPLGRQLSQTRAGSVMSYEYDAVGNRTKRTDYLNQITTYTYDNLNRLTNVTYPDVTENITLAYDNISRLTTATKNAQNVTFVYNNRNWITSTTDVHGKVVAMTYDAAGNRSALKLDAVNFSTYIYDFANRLTKITNSSDAKAVNYAYDNANRMTTKTLPNGVATTYTYDGMSRLTRLKDAKGATVLYDKQYAYNPANQISQIADLAQTKNFGYDNVDRLTGVTGSSTETYAFDGVGNRTSSNLSATYAYQPNNRLTNTATASYAYNVNGNMTSKTDTSGTTNFVWDYENRLKQATKPNGTIINFKYDALGRRSERNVNGTVWTKFTYDGQDVMLDQNSDGTTVRYLNGLGIDNKLRMQVGTTVSYFLSDHLGSTTAQTDATGNVTNTANYDSFGNATGNLNTRYQFTGREFDADLGLQYSRARFYDAKLGRFISEDPIGFAGKDINLYGYVWNSPIKLVDPQGTDGGATLVLGGGAAIGAEGLGGLAALGPPGAVAAGGAVLIYGAYHLGEAIAQYRFPEQYGTPPFTQAKPIPLIPPFPIVKSGTGCDAKPKPWVSPFTRSPSIPFEDPPEDRDGCAQEWSEAIQICATAIRTGNKGLTGGYTDEYNCARGLVSRRCGGNRIE
jgi:RHS repeat-associated protein